MKKIINEITDYIKKDQYSVFEDDSIKVLHFHRSDNFRILIDNKDFLNVSRSRIVLALKLIDKLKMIKEMIHREAYLGLYGFYVESQTDLFSNENQLELLDELFTGFFGKEVWINR